MLICNTITINEIQAKHALDIDVLEDSEKILQIQAAQATILAATHNAQIYNHVHPG